MPVPDHDPLKVLLSEQVKASSHGKTFVLARAMELHLRSATEDDAKVIPSSSDGKVDTRILPFAVESTPTCSHAGNLRQDTCGGADTGHHSPVQRIIQFQRTGCHCAPFQMRICSSQNPALHKKLLEVGEAAVLRATVSRESTSPLPARK